MNAIFAAMLSLQHKLNVRTIGPEWAEQQEQDWHLAISQECAEGIDHLGWKWWAKMNTNVKEAQVEVIDILHFALSAEMVDNANLPVEELATRLNESFEDRYSPVYLDEQKFDVTNASPVQLFQLIAGLAAVGRTHMGLITLLAEKLGMNVIEMSVLYRKKATLNLFRQNNGYRDGSYVKMWAPNLEDNTFLDTLALGINWSNPSAQDLFYGRLNVKYLEVTQALTKH